MSSEYVFDVTAATFESSVIARSQHVPVLLDFWAEWCGPCKTLRPTLDKLADEYGGSFVVGAIDTEVEQELAYAFQVQGIPFCVLIHAGRPVDAFQGAVPEAEVRQFLARAGIEPAAAAGGAAKEPEQELLDRGREAVARGDWSTARTVLGEIPEEHAAAAAAGRLLEGLEMFEAELDPSESAAAEDAARGRDAFVRGDYAGAVEAWIDSIRADRAWRGGLARRAAVAAFEMLDVDERGRELVRELRGRMATALY